MCYWLKAFIQLHSSLSVNNDHFHSAFHLNKGYLLFHVENQSCYGNKSLPFFKVKSFPEFTQSNNEQHKPEIWEHIQIFGRPPNWQKQQRLFKQLNNKTWIIYCGLFCQAGNESARKTGSYPDVWVVEVDRAEVWRIYPSQFIWTKHTGFKGVSYITCSGKRISKRAQVNYLISEFCTYFLLFVTYFRNEKRWLK